MNKSIIGKQDKRLLQTLNIDINLEKKEVIITKEIYVKKNVYLVQKLRQTMVIKNFFYTWLNYKVREKRKQQKKIVIKKKTYGSRERKKVTKKQTTDKSR